MSTRPEPQLPPHGGSWLLDDETGVLTPNPPVPVVDEPPAEEEQV